MPAFGPWRTSLVAPHMSAFGGLVGTRAPSVVMATAQGRWFTRHRLRENSKVDYPGCGLRRVGPWSHKLGIKFGAKAYICSPRVAFLH